MNNELTHEEICILQYLKENFYISRPEAFRLFSVTSDYSINNLFDSGYVNLLKAPSSDELDWFILTVKGQSYINEYNHRQKEKNDEISRLRRDTMFSRITSIIAIIISIIAIIIPVLFE